MPNTNPIFPILPVAGAATLTAAATEKDGSTATTLITAGENGTRLEQAIVKPIGTNAATVVRFFITGTGLNTILTEQTIGESTASEVAALDEYVIPLNFVLPHGSVLKAALGTTVAAGIQITAFGGNY
jgi:hypothetical protein